MFCLIPKVRVFNNYGVCSDVPWHKHTGQVGLSLNRESLVISRAAFCRANAITATQSLVWEQSMICEYLITLSLGPGSILLLDDNWISSYNANLNIFAVA